MEKIANLFFNIIEARRKLLNSSEHYRRSTLLDSSWALDPKSGVKVHQMFAWFTLGFVKTWQFYLVIYKVTSFAESLVSFWILKKYIRNDDDTGN